MLYAHGGSGPEIGFLDALVSEHIFGLAHRDEVAAGQHRKAGYYGAERLNHMLDPDNGDATAVHFADRVE